MVTQWKFSVGIRSRTRVGKEATKKCVATTSLKHTCCFFTEHFCMNVWQYYKNKLRCAMTLLISKLHFPVCAFRDGFRNYNVEMRSMLSGFILPVYCFKVLHTRFLSGDKLCQLNLHTYCLNHNHPHTVMLYVNLNTSPKMQ